MHVINTIRKFNVCLFIKFRNVSQKLDNIQNAMISKYNTLYNGNVLFTHLINTKKAI